MMKTMKFRFQTFVDLQTSTTSMQVIQWSVGGQQVVKRCQHLFGAFKYFRLGKISVKFVPASTLPVDPQGLSLDPDDPYTVDPVDQMNLGLVRITNGEDIYTNVSALSDDQVDRVYKTMLLDPRWSKFSLQSGFRRSAYPLYWQVGQLSQDKYPGSIENRPILSTSSVSSTVTGVTAIHSYKTGVVDNNNYVRANTGSSARGLFQTGMRGRLGYLPTDYYQQVATDADIRFVDQYGINNVPEVKVITAILPKASKTVYYYRCYITEEVYFKGVRSSVPFFDDGAGHQYGGTGLDNFLYGGISQVAPTTPMLDLYDAYPHNDGENLP